MDLQQLYATYGMLTMAILALVAFTAGFIDAIVGGGGLIQLPFLLINFETIPLPVIFGSNKIASLSGTSVAAVRYARQVKFNVKLLFAISACCFVASFGGAQVIEHIKPSVLKPLVLIILILVAIYTFIKKDFGHTSTKNLSERKQLIYGALIGLIVGFYDGFFGPGTGSFFVMGFVMILGFDFLLASAYAKVVNCITNISALIVFIRDGNYILPLAILMAIFNMAGSYIGSLLAIKKGNGFIRIIFQVIVTILILKYGYDIFVKGA
jgi:hypothetical protein